MLTKNTATDIALAYREIESGEKLLGEIEEAIDRHKDVDIRDAFGRRVDGLELGVRTDSNGRRLFNVPWDLARPVIKAHLAAQRAQLEALCELARVELNGSASARDAESA